MEKDTDILHKYPKEVDYNKRTIKSHTPYLNSLTYTQRPGLKNEREVELPLKYRSYAWYYVYNGGNKNDAYRRAYHCKYNRETCKLVPNNDITGQAIAMGGNRLWKMEIIQRCIVLIREEIDKKIRAEVPQTMLQQLKIQAMYDPAMFINVDGSPAFKTWDDIPHEYRCCIEGIKTTKNGTEIKLVDREKSREKLLALAPELLLPAKVEVTHKTIDEDGNETGLNIAAMTDEQLQRIARGEGFL
jgi:hypothetical protein